MKTNPEEILPYRILEVAEAETLIGRWVRTNWRSHKPPRHHLVFQIKGIIGPHPGNRYFLDLWDPLEEKSMPPVDLDYPLIHLTAQEAQMRLDAWRQAVYSGAATRRTLARVTSSPGKLNIPQPTQEPNPSQSTPLERLPTLPRPRYARNIPTVAGVVREMTREGADNKAIMSRLIETFPDRDPKSMRALIYTTTYEMRKQQKADKATLDSPETPA